jgi:hypothetical protein
VIYSRRRTGADGVEICINGVDGRYGIRFCLIVIGDRYLAFGIFFQEFFAGRKYAGAKRCGHDQDYAIVFHN